MVIKLLILALSLFLVVFSANHLVDGASCLARKLGVSEFLIGALIVGFGTSLPELVVSLVGAIGKNADIALGNLIGSNIFNTTLILGLSTVASVAPIIVTNANRNRDIPFLILATVLFIVFGLNFGGLGRVEGGILLLTFIIYVLYLLYGEKNSPETELYEENAKPKYKTIFGCLVVVVFCLLTLIYGGQMFVTYARKVGELIGISDKIIGITVLAFGTSLPELATCIAAVIKKKPQLALGNIIGSNIFNILLIAGVASLVHPLGFDNINFVDMFAVAASTFILFVSQHTYHRGVFTKFDGACMLAIFTSYMIMLFAL